LKSCLLLRQQLSLRQQNRGQSQLGKRSENGAAAEESGEAAGGCADPGVRQGEQGCLG